MSHYELKNHWSKILVVLTTFIVFSLEAYASTEGADHGGGAPPSQGTRRPGKPFLYRYECNLELYFGKDDVFSGLKFQLSETNPCLRTTGTESWENSQRD